MKKTITKLLFCLAITCLAGSMYAQSTLTGANMNPQAGETFISYQGYDTATYISPGSSGANVTWDFHTFVADSMYAFPETFAACNSTPDCGFFPGGNLAYVNVDSNYNGTNNIADTTYYYYAANSNSLSILGFINSISSYPDTGIDVNYIILQYPFTYSNSFTNNYSGQEHYIDTNDTGYEYYYGTQTQTCDGYGTLITPAGTFENVLRVHTIQVETDSDTYDGGSFDVSYYRQDNYDWYMPGFHGTLFDVESNYDSTASQGVDGPYYSADYTTQLPTAVPTVNNTETTFELYPNPAKETLNIKFNVPGRQAVSVTMLDMLGREIAVIGSDTYDQGAHQLAYNTSNLPKGIYFVHLQSSTGSVTRKIEVM